MAAIKGRPHFWLGSCATHPFNTLENICKWFADLGYAGVQIPGWDRRVIDIDQAATSNTYCDDSKESLPASGCQSRKWPLISRPGDRDHPAYEAGFAGFIHPACGERHGMGRQRSAQIH